MASRKLRTDIQTSKRMAATRSVDTKPELRVRSQLHRLGFRFRLHARDLPGKPDIVMPKYGTVIRVHGCFWHSHGCADCRAPERNRWYWEPKLARNKRRDMLTGQQLRRLGWRVLNIWECRLKRMSDVQLARYLNKFIDTPARNNSSEC